MLDPTRARSHTLTSSRLSFIFCAPDHDSMNKGNALFHIDDTGKRMILPTISA
jgi:hypothetical protein